MGLKVHRSSSHSNVAKELPYSDGGWGWAVCFGAFMVHILTVGQQNIAGVIYSELVDEFDTGRAESGNILQLRKMPWITLRKPFFFSVEFTDLIYEENCIGRSVRLFFFFYLPETRACSYNPQLSKI